MPARGWALMVLSGELSEAGAILDRTDLYREVSMSSAVTTVAQEASTRVSVPRSLWAREELARFDAYLAGRDDLSQRSRETYRERVADLLTWLETRSERQEALCDPTVRDRVVLAYQDHLIGERRVKPSTVNLAHAAINTFYRWRGVGPTTLARIKHPPRTPHTLTAAQLSTLLRAAAAHSHRDHAIIGLLLNNGLSMSEIRLLNVEWLTLRADTGHLKVRGPSGNSRTVVLGASTRRLLELWLVERRALLGALRPRAMSRTVRAPEPGRHRARRRCPSRRMCFNACVKMRGADTVPAGSAGYDAGKKIKGRKRHIATDTCGLLLAVVVIAASIQDRDAAHRLLAAVRACLATVSLVFADGGRSVRSVVFATRAEGTLLSARRQPHEPRRSRGSRPRTSTAAAMVPVRCAVGVSMPPGSPRWSWSRRGVGREAGRCRCRKPRSGA
ncbi:phage integrase N-terminal SAM-like domain-containing protein [Nocardia amamiensis]|uniref:Phage integrase N-terminal SAM-like domain-containing protein n=1 Tax=Nocardia amamiensis TaxID=404578 RepID=A0ABS0CUZ8_9NOCA|nr:phage integrase N-terminal SAM-like domain-containing protein [Nocardia amamiensis]